MKMAALTALVGILLATVPQALATEANLEGPAFNPVPVEAEQYQPAAESGEIRGHTDAQIWEMTRGIDREGGVEECTCDD